MERISSGFGRREFSCKRVEYQVVASVHSWSIATSGRMRSQFPNFFDLKLREPVSHGHLVRERQRIKRGSLIERRGETFNIR